MNAEEEHFTDADDFEEVSLSSSRPRCRRETCLGNFPPSSPGLTSRTARSRRRYAIDGSPAVSWIQHTVRAALAGKRLTRRDPDGKVEQLTSDEAVNLVCAAPYSLQRLSLTWMCFRSICWPDGVSMSRNGRKRWPAPTATIPPDFSVRSRRS